MTTYNVKYTLDEETEANILGHFLESFGYVAFSNVTGEWSLLGSKLSKAMCKLAIKDLLKTKGIVAFDLYAHSPGVLEIAKELLAR